MTAVDHEPAMTSAKLTTRWRIMGMPAQEALASKLAGRGGGEPPHS